MSPIIIASQAADLNGGEPDTRTFQVLPRHRLRLAITEHTGRTSAIFETDAVARVRAGSGIGAARGRGTRNLGRSSPINSFGASKALRNLPRFKRDYQPCRIGLILAGPASSQHAFHVTLSSYAVGSHVHLTTGASACPNQGGANPHRNGANP